jgi:hypothetical protein
MAATTTASCEKEDDVTSWMYSAILNSDAGILDDALTLYIHMDLDPSPLSYKTTAYHSRAPESARCCCRSCTASEDDPGYRNLIQMCYNGHYMHADCLVSDLYTQFITQHLPEFCCNECLDHSLDVIYRGISMGLGAPTLKYIMQYNNSAIPTAYMLKRVDNEIENFTRLSA